MNYNDFDRIITKALNGLHDKFQKKGCLVWYINTVEPTINELSYSFNSSSDPDSSIKLTIINGKDEILFKVLDLGALFELDNDRCSINGISAEDDIVDLIQEKVCSIVKPFIK
ncbi:hypothetical protein AAA214_06075 [Parabacteroides goldsteinii]|uniref:hypothetical protein n=1 Tax=Parabacteroides goldsteinii TaxID=328812 RepID=UPI0032C0E8F2